MSLIHKLAAYVSFKIGDKAWAKPESAGSLSVVLLNSHPGYVCARSYRYSKAIGMLSKLLIERLLTMLCFM
jgi:hypothetical protein